MPDPTPKPIAVKLRENLAHLRRIGAPRERIEAEIERAREAMARESANDVKLNPAEKVAGFISKAASGATFGGFDELASIAGGKDEQRFLQKQVAAEHPVGAFVAEVAGGIAVPGGFLKAAPKAASLGVKAARVLGEGAIQGGLSGLGNAEGSLANRATALRDGAGLGLAGAGVLSGVTRGVGKVAGGLGQAIKLTVPKLDDQMEKMGRNNAVQVARQKLAELRELGLADEARVADVFPEGESALRAAATANMAVRKNVDATLRQRMNRLATHADDRFSDLTGTARQSAVKTVAEMQEEARRKASPFYAKAAEEADDFDRANPLKIQMQEQAARTEGGRLTSNLRQVSDDDLAKEYARLHDVNSDDAGINAGVLRDDENFHTFEDGRHFLTNNEAGMKAGGRINSRKMAIAKIEAELERRGMKPEDALWLANKESFEDFGNFGDDVADVVDAPEAKEARGLLEQALQLPTIRSEIHRLSEGGMHGGPRYNKQGLAPQSFEMLDQVYKNIGQKIRLIGKKMESVPPTATLDEMDLRDSLIRERDILRQAMVKRSPSYGDALSTFADDKALEDAYTLGTRAKKTPSDMIPRLMGDLEPAEQPFFRMGAAQSLRRDVPNMDLGEFARFQDVLAPVATREAAETFKATFGEEAYRKYVRELLGMAQLQRMKAGAGESTSIDKLMEQATANPEQLVGLVRGILTGSPSGIISNVPIKALDRLRQSKAAQQNADFLLRGGPARPDAPAGAKAGADDLEAAIAEVEAFVEAAKRPGSRRVKGAPERVIRAIARQAAAERGKRLRGGN